MLAPQGAEELTVEAFHTVVTECAAHAASVAADEDSGALARLAAIATSVQERTLELGKAFRETNRGAPVTLTQMVRSLLAVRQIPACVRVAVPDWQNWRAARPSQDVCA